MSKESVRNVVQGPGKKTKFDADIQDVFERHTELVKTNISLTKRLMVSVPLTGMLRAEWVLARYGQTIPCNWSQVEIIHWLDQYSPMGFLVADARNVAVHHCIKDGFEWLLFIDHDVILPHDAFIRFNDYMLKGDVPIVGGVYFTKSVPSEPLMYRGRGTSYFKDWKFGEKVWLDGMGLGCHLLHRSLLEVVWNESEEYRMGDLVIRKVFETPSATTYDAEKNVWLSMGGTEDLTFYSRLMNDKVYERAGWPKFQKMQYPLLCDTNLFCRHIDLMSGTMYPAAGEEKEYLKTEPKKVVKK